MNTTTTTYTVVPAMFDAGKFEVTYRLCGLTMFLRRKSGPVRVFSTRSGARKAIVRALRAAAGEPGALHR